MESIITKGHGETKLILKNKTWNDESKKFEYDV